MILTLPSLGAIGLMGAGALTAPMWTPLAAGAMGLGAAGLTAGVKGLQMFQQRKNTQEMAEAQKKAALFKTPQLAPLAQGLGQSRQLNTMLFQTTGMTGGRPAMGAI